MDNQAALYYTVFTVESLIPAIFLWLTALQFFLIQNRSKATTHMAVLLFVFGSVPFGYLITSTYLHSVTAYTRWFSAIVSLPASLHVVLLFLNFPTPIKKKWQPKILIIGWAVIIVIWIAFIISTLDVNTVYLFSGHYWDLDADAQQRMIARAIILSVLAFTAVGAWRIYLVKGKDKWVVFGILASFWIATVLPSVANLRSRQGLMTRGAFMTIFDILVVVGIFVMVIIYINNTRDRTSFMDKIIGISLVTFFLVLQFISNIALIEKESDYDRQKHRDALLAVHQVRLSDDFRYLVRYDLKKSSYSLEKYQNEKPTLDYQRYQSEYFNSFIYEMINKNNIESAHEMKRVVAAALPENQDLRLLGFVNALNYYLDDNTLTGKMLSAGILDYMLDLEKVLLPWRLKIEKIPNADFKNEIKKMLAKPDDRLAPYQSVIKEYLKEPIVEAQTDGQLKENVLHILGSVQNPLTRFYRQSSSEFYVSFLEVDLENFSVSEIGFSYIDYRKAIDQVAAKFIHIILAVILLVIFGFRMFFLGALVRPLSSLLNGLSDVQRGKKDVRLEVKVEDEIGFLTRSFNSMVRAIKAAELKLQRYAEGLEDKVKQRTAELSKTLRNVQSLKNQQDGDYFLTSLILRPLGANNAKSDNVKIDFLVEQKKKFTFRKWASDIGGDICISDVIILHGKRFISFINGDAMGKSMQGAGGALVLGAAYQSIIERSKLSPDVMKQAPERWLKNAFSEMHTIFESFDGSMLMSAVMGLVDEQTGLLYFINAEHPYTALYRDGEASFIEKDSIFRKLGSAILSGRISVNTYQLKHGDIVIAGSDGRDDLLLGVTEAGERIINEDEYIFLRAVEKGDGDLHEIYAQLERIGEFTDDLSFLRIEYNSPEIMETPDPLLINYLKQARIARYDKKVSEALSLLEKAKTEGKQHPLLLKELLKTYLLKRNYNEAVQIGELYIGIVPSDKSSMFATSFALKMVKEYDKAIEMGERIRLRDPDMVNNLVNLAESYFLVKNYDRSQKIALEALKLDQGNKKASVIVKKIDKIYAK